MTVFGSIMAVQKAGWARGPCVWSRWWHCWPDFRNIHSRPSSYSLSPFGKELGLNNKIDKAGRLAAAITADGVLFGCDVFLYKGVATASFPIRNGRLTTRAPFELNVIVGDSPTAIRINIDPKTLFGNAALSREGIHNIRWCAFSPQLDFFFVLNHPLKVE